MCSRLLCYSKCSGFTICFTYGDISVSMLINQCSINVELPYVRYVVVLLPQKRFLSNFERFWVRRLLFLIVEGQGRNPCFERAPGRERFSPWKSHHPAFKLCSKKVERFTLLLLPSDRKSWLSSDASLRRTVRGGPNGVHLRESYVYCLLWVVHKRFKFIVRLVIIS